MYTQFLADCIPYFQVLAIVTLYVREKVSIFAFTTTKEAHAITINSRNS